MKTERFEMRLDEELACSIDAWRDANMGGASRAQAVRGLIAHGLNSSGTTRFSDGEKTLMALMADLFSHVGAPQEKIAALLGGFASGNHWVADLEMGYFYTPPKTSFEAANFVQATLEMWDIFELAFDSFTEEQKVMVLADTPGEAALRQLGRPTRSREVRFLGFSAINENELVEIAAHLIDGMHRFPRFKGRNLAFQKTETRRYIQSKLDFYNRLKPNLSGRLPTPQEVRDFTLASPGVLMQEVMALMEINDQKGQVN